MERRYVANNLGACLGREEQLTRMTEIFGATGWMMVMFVKRRIRLGRENQAQFERTEFEMLVI